MRRALVSKTLRIWSTPILIDEITKLVFNIVLIILLGCYNFVFSHLASSELSTLINGSTL